MADRPASPGSEVEVTPEMIEAGVEMLWGFDWSAGFSNEVATDVYRAMADLDPSRLSR